MYWGRIKFWESRQSRGGEQVRADFLIALRKYGASHAGPPSSRGRNLRNSRQPAEGRLMYISKNASRIRQREAQNARNNRAEIVKALSLGQITRRDLYKWGLFTATGVIAVKNGLSPLAPSAFADGGVPTGTPPSPLFGAQKFT